MRLKDKVIIITGSTTGIGQAIACQCAAEGASIVIHGRDPQRAKAVVASLPGESTYCIEDLADPDSPDRIVRTAIDAFGKVDGLVNNAAYIVRSNLETTDAGLFDRAMAVNARAPLLLINSALPYLRKTHGSVVNIGSINAYTGEPKQLAYAMSKAALVTLSRNSANVLASDQVRVTHFNVGWVITSNERKLKISEGLPDDWAEHPDLQHVPTGRMTQPEQIAKHAVFWLSDESRPISGSVIDLEQYPIIGRIPLKEGDRHDA